MGLIAKRRKQYKSTDGYLKELWRPVMAWNYAVIVLFDFLLAPIMLSAYTVYTHQNYIQWQPLTIQGGGMFHIAMGAILGISAWSHGQEKINAQQSQPQPPTTSGTIPPIPNWPTSQYNQPMPYASQNGYSQPQPTQPVVVPQPAMQPPVNVPPFASQPAVPQTPAAFAAPSSVLDPGFNQNTDPTEAVVTSGIPKAKKF